jgi:hypothetical protein
MYYVKQLMEPTWENQNLEQRKLHSSYLVFHIIRYLLYMIDG